MLWVRIAIRTRCTTLCDKVYQWLATGRWFSAGPLVSSINKTDRHDIAEILLKVTLNTIKQTSEQTYPNNCQKICMMSITCQCYNFSRIWRQISCWYRYGRFRFRCCRCHGCCHRRRRCLFKWSINQQKYENLREKLITCYYWEEF